MQQQKLQDQVQSKIVLLGSSGVGKTCLIHRFINDIFSETTTTSQGASSVKKQIKYQDETINFDIWDTAGQERYNSIANLYYNNAQVAIIVYDITDKQTFQNAKTWIDTLLYKGPQNICLRVKTQELILVGNKSDLITEEQVNFSEAQDVSSNFGASLFLTSCKQNIGIKEVFEKAAELTLIFNVMQSQQPAVRPASKFNDPLQMKTDMNITLTLQKETKNKQNCC